MSERDDLMKTLGSIDTSLTVINGNIETIKEDSKTRDSRIASLEATRTRVKGGLWVVAGAWSFIAIFVRLTWTSLSGWFHTHS